MLHLYPSELCPPPPQVAAIDPTAETSHNWLGTAGNHQFSKCLWLHISEEMSCLVLHAGFRLSYSLSLWCFVDTAGYPQVCSMSFSYQFMCILWAQRCFGRKWSCAKNNCSCLSSCLPFFLYLAASEEGESYSCGKEKLPKVLCRVMAGVQIYNCPGAMCQLRVLGSSPTNSPHCF